MREKVDLYILTNAKVHFSSENHSEGKFYYQKKKRRKTKTSNEESTKRAKGTNATAFIHEKNEQELNMVANDTKKGRLITREKKKHHDVDCDFSVVFPLFRYNDLRYLYKYDIIYRELSKRGLTHILKYPRWFPF